MTCRGIGCVWMQDALSIPLLSFSPPPLYHNHPPHVHLPWMSPHLPASLSQYIKPPPHITSPTCLIQTRPNSSKLVQTCPNSSKLVQTCPICFLFLFFLLPIIFKIIDSRRSGPKEVITFRYMALYRLMK